MTSHLKKESYCEIRVGIVKGFTAFYYFPQLWDIIYLLFGCFLRVLLFYAY